MLIKEKIEHTQFSPSETTVIDYLLNHLPDIEKLTTTRIAKETYTSKSTIVNIAKKLNFNGWLELRNALFKEYHYFINLNESLDANYPFSKTDNALQIAQNIAQLKKISIEETQQLNDFATLTKACQLLYDSQHIHVFGLSNNLLIAQEFVYNLKRIRKQASIYTLHGEGRMMSTLLTSSDCALVISYSGETEALVQMTSLLHHNNVPIVAISNIGDSSISQLATVTLRISTRERLYSKISTFSTDASITYLLDVLYSLIFAKDYELNIHTRKQSSKIVEVSRQTQSHILKESDY